jgi:branched-chain amino acid transport system permease protein
MMLLGELIASGIAVGAIYGLIGMGFAVIYKATGLVNFAQGEMTMIVAYIAWTISTVVSGNVFVVAVVSSCGQCSANRCSLACW